MLVRERIAAGDSDDQVIAYIRSRYGDFVLLKPPLETGTLLLWGGPVLIVLFGVAMIGRFYRGRPAPAPAPPLSEDERRRLDALLKGSGGR